MNEQMMQALLEEAQKGNRLRGQQLLATRLCTLLLLAVLAVFGFLAGQARQLSGSIQQFTQVAQQLDVSALNDSLSELKTQLEQLDVAGINEALEKMGGAAAQLEQAVEGFNKLGDSFGGLFGR